MSYEAYYDPHEVTQCPHCGARVTISDVDDYTVSEVRYDIDSAETSVYCRSCQKDFRVLVEKVVEIHIKALK